MATTVITALHAPPPTVMLDFEGLTRAGELFAEWLPGGAAG